MKLVLKTISAIIFVVMVYVTVRAGMQISIFDVWATYAKDPWAVATLYDAYSGFTLFWLWVAYRERSWGARIIWLVLIMALGNIATSAYLFLQLIGLGDHEPASALFSRKAS